MTVPVGNKEISAEEIFIVKRFNAYASVVTVFPGHNGLQRVFRLSGLYRKRFEAVWKHVRKSCFSSDEFDIHLPAVRYIEKFNQTSGGKDNFYVKVVPKTFLRKPSNIILRASMAKKFARVYDTWD